LSASSLAGSEAAVHLEAGRHERYTTLVLPEVAVLLRVAMSMTGQTADAEDLVQDTLLRAWRSLDTFNGQHPRAWLLTIQRNAHINRHRRRRPELLDDPDLTFERQIANGPQQASAEDVVVDGTFDTAVERAIDTLPEHFRTVVLLIDAAGLSYLEAAELLGVPEGTITSRLHRARRRVRDALAAADLAPRRRRL
jgi:RNA polymerase sigma-70 factor (ECF subfamily)